MRIILTLFLILCWRVSPAQSRYAVVIDEIFADPSPAVGLPNCEWIEIRNRSAQPISLQGWRIADGNGQSAPFPNLFLQPDSLLLVSSTSGAALLNAYGRCIGLTGFPSLDNDGETIWLKTAGGQVMHAIAYSVNWHKTELKKQGGWSLEMIDPRHPGLFASNWTSSIHLSGGTPGKINAAAARVEDRDPPQLLNAYSIDSSTLLLCFDEALDSAWMSQEAFYRLSHDREITDAYCLPPLYDRIQLRSDWPLLRDKIYTLTLLEATDLTGNRLTTPRTIRIGIPSTPDSNDLRINEILFDPPNGCTDYVELLLTGKKIINLSRLFLSSRSPGGGLGSIQPISSEPRYVFPGDHLVLATDPESITRHYFVKQPELLVKTDALPSLPDTEGDLTVLNEQGRTVDALSYRADWHFPLLNDKSGVALERIDPGQATQEKHNWQSAASTVGHGTPTYRNSQYHLVQSNQTIELSSNILSPNRDGRDDIIQLSYRSEQGGNRIRLRIFHSSGVPVRELANQQLTGTLAVFSWDGLDARGNALPVGQYLLLIETTDLNGRMERFKKVVAIVNG